MLCYVERLKHLLPIFMRWDGETRSGRGGVLLSITSGDAHQCQPDSDGCGTADLNPTLQCDCNSMAFTSMICCSERKLFLFSLKNFSVLWPKEKRIGL